MITRRNLLATFAAGSLAPRALLAQQQVKTPRIGVLLAGTPAGFAIRTEAFLQELRHLGYVEGKNVIIEWRWAENQPEQIPRLAAELAGLGVDVIVTGGTAPARALKNATRTIPIVMARSVIRFAPGSSIASRGPAPTWRGSAILCPPLPRSGWKYSRSWSLKPRAW